MRTRLRVRGGRNSPGRHGKLKDFCTEAVVNVKERFCYKREARWMELMMRDVKWTSFVVVTDGCCCIISVKNDRDP